MSALGDVSVVNHCRVRLHNSGWAVAESNLCTAAGLVWIVSGANGEKVIIARGATQADAWWQAVEQARSIGMLVTK